MLLVIVSISLAGCTGTAGSAAAPVNEQPTSSTISVAPANVSLLLGATQLFTATVSSGSSSVIWAVNGVAGGNANFGTITSGGVYTAPADLPPLASVDVQASSSADASKSGKAVVNIASDVSLSVSPQSVSVELGATRALAMTLNSAGKPDRTVRWTVSGSGCAATACGTVDAGGIYTAPQILVAPPIVNVVATSSADPSKIASVTITITSSFSLSIAGPASAATGTVTNFTALLAPAPNSNPSRVIFWTLSGLGCSLASCGAISPNGQYSAPAAAPTPAIVQIRATPAADPAKFAVVSVAITTSVNDGQGPAISSISPSSANAGSAGTFTLRLTGTRFAASTPGPGSLILISGVARTTFCAAATDCTTSFTATDLALAGPVSVRLQNPDGLLSNIVSFIVVGAGTGAEVIFLTPGAPSAAGKDIVVAELGTNGGSGAGSNANLNVAALGAYVVATSSCTLGGNPVVIVRPAVGFASADLCLFSMSGLDASYLFSVSGGFPADIVVTTREPLGLGIIHLGLQVAASAATGPRTLFIENPNKDRAAATGALEVR